MNWIEESLKNINSHLERAERNNEINANGGNTLGKSKVWSLTKKEHKAIKESRNKFTVYDNDNIAIVRTMGYLVPRNFLYKKYNVIANTNKERIEQMEKYIKDSAIWEKRSINISQNKGNDIKWIFAINYEWKAVICRYKDRYIICSQSSHENIIKEMKKKPLAIINQFDSKNQNLPF
ncbi:MAG: hypothetical protein DRN14_06140 [Thermoplasmata archaeon]|nr:MAG: hypothetical protein DRN14_06140 [Thermoplasmata archaeon]